MKHPLRFGIFFSALCAGMFAGGCKYTLHLLGEKSDGANSMAPVVFRTNPDEGANALGTNIKIGITFAQPIAPASVTINTADSICSGAIQISANDFASCVQLAGTPEISLADTNVTVTPISLAANTLHKLRVTTAIRSAEGKNLPAQYTSAEGFMTASGVDTVAPQLVLTPSFLLPSNGSTNIALNSGIAVSFLEPVLTSTITTNTLDTSCGGSIQLSTDGFVSCIRMASQPVPSNGNKTFVVFPAASLAASTLHSLRLKGSITDLAANAFSEITTTFTTGTLAATAAPSVASTTPADTASNQVVSTPILVTFSTAMDPTSLTINTIDTTCSGSIQVSKDNFVNCVKLRNSYLLSNTYTYARYLPELPLSNGATYKVRTTSAAQDMRGIPATPYTSPSGFSIEAAGGGGSVVYITTPPELSSFNYVHTPFTITFSKPMLPGSVTVNTANNTCAGFGLQIAIVGTNWTGTNCLRFSAQPIAEQGNTRFTVYPTTVLAANTFYGIRITTAVLDYTSAAVSAYDSSTGIKTAP